MKHTLNFKKNFVWMGSMTLMLFVAPAALAKAKGGHATAPAAATPPNSPQNAYLSQTPPGDTMTDIPDLNFSNVDVTRLSLEDCVGIAIHSATNVLHAQNNTELTGAILLQSYGQFLPNLTATANTVSAQGTEFYATTTPTVVNGNTATAGYGIAADLNIFNGLYDLTHLKASLLRRDASELSVYRAKQAIALDVTQSFLTVVLDDQLVGIARKNLQQSQAREKLLQEQTRVGSKSLADLFRQQAQLSTDESLLLTAENKKRSDQILLLQKLRADVSKNYVFVDYQITSERLNERFDDERALLQIGLSQRADLKASDKSANAAHYDVTSQHSTYWPKLDLQAAVNAGGAYLYSQTVAGVNVVPPSQTPLYNQLGNQTEYTVGLVLTWTLFDRFVTNQQVAQANVRARNADIDNQDLKNQVQADVRLAFSSYKTAIQQVRSSKKGLVAAQKAYEVIEGRYEVGSANFIDLITSQSALLQAESSRVQALTDFVLQGKAIEFATGEIKVD